MKKMSNLLKYIAPAFMLGMFTLVVSCDDDDEAAIDDSNLIFMEGELNGAEFKDSATDVLTNVDISLIFSHEMVTAAVTDNLSISGGNGAADFNVDFTNTNSTLLLSSSDELAYETTYTISLPAGAYGAKGETLNDDFSVSFTTQAFIPPQVSLSVTTIEIEENGGSATLTAALDKPADNDVTVVLESVGSATLDADFTLDPLSVVIPAGSLEATATITSLLDSENEINEEIIIGIASVTNADAGEPSSVVVTIQEQAAPLSLKGIMAMTWDGSGTNDGKAIHLIANEAIADLSVYGLGIANNGGGTDGRELDLPAISVAAGDHILVVREPALLEAYFGACFAEFDHVIPVATAVTQNGDDAIELFSGDQVIETYGDANVDGTGEPWEYTGSWAYKYDGEWITGGVDCTVGATTMDASSCVYPLCAPAVELKGVLALLWDGSGTNGGKAWHLRVNKDVEDLSIYGIGVANNGGGTDGQEFTLPAVSAKEGDNILIAREPGTITAYFGGCANKFDLVIDSQDTANQNGDDAIELFENGVVIETYGDANVDGTGEGWEYSGTWAYKMDGIWTVGGLDCAATATSNANSACPYPECN
ncbi:Ig-like domain-containing protein [Robertkochia sediminum]|uniref:Ig-like domain-containing protein n=1 Tax=Robertkochia sediminum TaxID=2785326 RepID=UPI00193152B4|nr:Ig-like domain-containing protein [Robertkochia sediminum]MBL7471417.1 Ig-like domain-containing protein [Robertkochia sediminum]